MGAYAFVDVAGTSLPDFAPAEDTLVFGEGGGAKDLDLAASGEDAVVTWFGQSVTLVGVSPTQLAGHQFVFADGTKWRQGGGNNDIFQGSVGADAFDLRAGGSDRVNAGDGDDIIDLGSALDAADRIDGQGGQGDVVRLAGDYAQTVVLSDTTLRGVEQFILGSGGTIRLQLSNAVLTSATPPSYQAVRFDASSQTAMDAVDLDGRLAQKAFEAVMGAGDDTVQGGTRNDTLAGGAGDNLLAGHAGDDGLEAYSLGRSTLLGGMGDDTLLVTSGSAGTSQLVLAGGSGSDTVIGGEGNDQLMAAGWEDAVGDAVIDETWTRNLMNGQGGNDMLRGSAGQDTLVGGSGDDTLLGGHGNDSLLGGEGDDRIHGDAGDDALDGGTGWDVLAGGAGKDAYVIRDSAQQIVEKAGGGFDTVVVHVSDYTLGEHVEYARLATTSPYGEGFPGRLVGNAQDNELVGWGGDDTLVGGAGNDTLRGSEGVNKLVGGSGDDKYEILWGFDTVVEAADEGIDTVVLSHGSFVLSAHIEHAVLEGGDGTLVGNAKDNHLTSTTYGALLRGLGGNDTLVGSAYNKLEGGAGNDTYVVTSGSLPGTVRELAGQGIDTLVSNASSTSLGDHLENLTLQGEAWEGLGNKLANVIRGSDKANVLDGLAGADTLAGGGGNDQYYVRDAGDVVVEDSGGGRDRILVQFNYTLGANVEELYLYRDESRGMRGTGNALNNTLTVDVLYSSDDTLDGGVGADSMDAGNGDDLYLVDNAGDRVTEGAHYGNDTARSVVNYTLGATTENLELAGDVATTGKGNALDNRMVGNANANVLFGAGGDDTLDGGSGNDRLVGGTGRDTYVVDSAGDRVEEEADRNTRDTVESWATSFRLGAFVENLWLKGAGDLKGFGNALANDLRGNAGDNHLDGGAGADTLQGGEGDDTYVVDHVDDRVYEFGDAGRDTVRSSMSCQLALDVEVLVLTGSAAIDGTGNGDDNRIVGNAAANRLDGGGGTDTLVGGRGDDTYVVEWGDVIVETADGGVDTVETQEHWKLSATMENLVLTGTYATDGVGNAKNNRLTGNAVENALEGGLGNDTLDGAAGADTLRGGSGSDRFAYRLATDSNIASGWDLIDDFARGVDKIDLSQFDGNARLAGVQPMTFIGTQDFRAGAATGQLRYEVVDGGVLVYGSIDADADFEFVVGLVGLSDLAAADFLL